MASKLVYWEKQDSDQLCGLHMINSILQAPIFNEFNLAEIGIELDKRERELITDPELQAQVLTNVNDSGNFTLQVLIEALRGISKDLNFIPIRAQDIFSQKFEEILKKCTAFVCHNNNHWIGIRLVDGAWYNLNSTNTRAPQVISEFLLATFFESVHEGGYLIFGIEGTFPVYDPKMFMDNLMPHQKFLTADFIHQNCENDKKRGKFKLNIGSGEQEAIDKALEESLKTWQESENKRLADEAAKNKKNASQIDQKAKLAQEVEKQMKLFQGQSFQISQAPPQPLKRCPIIRHARRP